MTGNDAYLGRSLDDPWWQHLHARFVVWLVLQPDPAVELVFRIVGSNSLEHFQQAILRGDIRVDAVALDGVFHYVMALRVRPDEYVQIDVVPLADTSPGDPLDAEMDEITWQLRRDNQ